MGWMWDSTKDWWGGEKDFRICPRLKEITTLGPGFVKSAILPSQKIDMVSMFHYLDLINNLGTQEKMFMEFLFHKFLVIFPLVLMKPRC